MKKIIISSLTVLALSLSQAAYKISIPLEISKGGHLPEGTINFPSNSETPEQPSNNWAPATPLYGEWLNNGEPVNCKNWLPEASTVTVGQAFTQTANDCQQPQTRSRQDRELETVALVFRNKGEPVTEYQSIVASSTQTSIGVKETWVAVPPIISDWVNSGAVTGCSNWTPDPSTIASGSSFLQTATNCSQTQTQSIQNIEQETTTGAIRHNGDAYTASKIITVSSTRNAVGTKAKQECMYSLNPEYHFRNLYRYGNPNYIVTAYWNKTLIWQGNKIPTSVVVNGYKYSPGAIMSSDQENNDVYEAYYYSICREAI